MNDLLIMTPGPTEIAESVRKAMAQPITNPDLDPEFFDFYAEMVSKLQNILHTENDVIVMSGEGILGLESACASLIEPGDRVLVINNGIFGKGFADFVRLYGGEVELVDFPDDRPVDADKLENLLKEDSDYKFSTLVHCETPTGILNPVEEITEVLNRYDILSVVDSVSAVGGVPVDVDSWGVDILLGGSQKCFSAPPGTTFMSISEAAWEMINNRETEVHGYYLNLIPWQNWYQKKSFPYTQAISDIYAFDQALDNWLGDEDVLLRHEKNGRAVRNTLQRAGLELFARAGFSDTVTAFKKPAGVDYDELNQIMADKYNVMIASSVGKYAKDILRIGHMGENCYEEKIYRTLKALDKTLRELGVELEDELQLIFAEETV
ncbi:alanine--glyoxylate aminotransferase family protein [Halanaerobiaceae bacterium Z-7014]|uniref:Alanine--glyoxylate aminotransferase family protein n=1 Tax=Halonatronomonas betaini TaxID=2778430 RepID=A0A931F9Y6_9FIRM|nr:alanine--glyoxylate aminotransferase family protein [Halonatronomonas betaini]MBF8438073.1 alanine--glyoxylate aminotransferase family protein [Halonatronomonas betaini]